MKRREIGKGKQTAKKQKKENEHKEEETDLYHSQTYWEERYQNKKGYHEWYFDYSCLEPLLEGNLSSSNAMVLELGCGDSPMVSAMKDHQQSCLHAIDFSETIVAKLLQDQSSLPKEDRIVYCVQDARNMTCYAANSFDLILEKGTVDAMLCDKKNGFFNVKNIIKEACRVLKKDVLTTFVMVSHMDVESTEFSSFMQQSVLPAMEEYQSMARWVIEAHTQSADASTESATVYKLVAYPRRATRATANNAFSGASVELTVFAHDE